MLTDAGAVAGSQLLLDGGRVAGSQLLLDNGPSTVQSFQVNAAVSKGMREY